MSNDININLTIKQGASETEIAALVAAEVKKHTNPKFPRWEELGEISGAYTTTNSGIEVSEQSRAEGHNRNAWPTKELAEACLALSQLAQLRDYVNDGWEPDWNYDNHATRWSDYNTTKYVIYCNTSGVLDCYASENITPNFLAFKNSETRDGFLEAYRDLIEVAKPLL